MSVVPKMKPPKAARKLNPPPGIVGAPNEKTTRVETPHQLSENDLIRKSLEADGVKMTGDPISLGGKLFVPIQPPATASATFILRIRRSLKAAGFKMTGDPISLGGKLFAGLHPRSLNKDAPVGNRSLGPHVAVDVPTPPMKVTVRRVDQNLLAARIAKKFNDPAGNPTMTVEQVAFAFSVSKQTIYRWIDKGLKQGPDRIQLTWAAHGKIRTELVRRALGLT